MRDLQKIFVKHLFEVAEKPGMYLSDPTYWGFCSFIEGFDHAHRGAILRRFASWRLKMKAPGNLGWSAAFLYTVFDSKDPLDEIAKSTKNERLAMLKLAEAFKRILK